MTNKEYYRVEVEADGCPGCGHGTEWGIVALDDTGWCTTFLDKGDADDLCEAMNHAANFAVRYEGKAGREATGA